MHAGFESKRQETRQDAVQSVKRKKKREKHSELGKKTKTHKYSCIINLQIKTNLYWIQTHKRFKRTLFIGTKTQICKFLGESPLFLEQKQSVLFQIFF